MDSTAEAKLGIVYIFWTMTAWSLYKFFFYGQIAALGEPTSTIVMETIRFLVFMGPIVIFILCNIKKPWYRWLGLYGCNKGSLYKTLVVTCIYAAISLMVNIYGFHKTAHLSSIPYIFWFTTFSLSIIMEEIAFRGFLFYLFEKWNKNIVVIVTSLAFAAKHIPGWFFFPTELSHVGFMGDFLMVFIVGSILGYVYLATHSIWATLLVHSVNNLIVALFY